MSGYDGASLFRFVQTGWIQLRQEDPGLLAHLGSELQRQTRVLSMVAASSVASPGVLACKCSPVENVTTEGYPGARYHGGCEIVDEIERLAVERARAAFGAAYANVQPHSGTSANEIVIFSLLQPGDTILGMDLDAGGHLSHGSPASVVGRYFDVVSYGVSADGLIDYEEVERLASAHRPRLIICGASAYPRRISFERFRAIADQVGAVLLADISHIAGLVAAGCHPSPIDHAHVTTTSTYKQLYGPRGGLILAGKDADEPLEDGGKSLAQRLQHATFPYFQGTPILGSIAAKALALGRVGQPEFRRLAERTVTDARALAAGFAERGYRVLTGGTDNHMVVLDVGSAGRTGVACERALERCRIVVNRNRIPGDTRPPLVTSGVRLGTNTVALRGMGAEEMATCVDLVDRVLASLDGSDDGLAADGELRRRVRRRVGELCDRFPIADYGGLEPPTPTPGSRAAWHATEAPPEVRDR